MILPPNTRNPKIGGSRKAPSHISCPPSHQVTRKEIAYFHNSGLFLSLVSFRARCRSSRGL